MAGVLHVGFYNYVTADAVVGLFDYKLAASKKIVKSAKEEKPRSVVDVTKGRVARTLVVLTGDRYVISAIHRQQLAQRLMPALEVSPTEVFSISGPASNSNGEILIDAQGQDIRP